MIKTVKVVAAVIIKENKVLGFKRGYGKQKGGWEFPGGKIENNETPEQALIREIKEELSMDILIDRFFVNVEHDYEDFHLSMMCYLCSMESEFMLNEHEDYIWLSKDELYSIKWLEADKKIIELLSDEL